MRSLRSRSRSRPEAVRRARTRGGPLPASDSTQDALITVSEPGRDSMQPMTLVFSVHSRDSLWVVVDRRLSYGGRRTPVDDAVKIMDLQTTDGHGVLAYAGIGATPRGTQPSEWMSAVLRGRGGMTFEQTLGVLANAATRELPKYLVSLPGGSHSIVIPAFVRGIGSRLYTIDNVVHPKTRQHWYRYTSHQRTADPGSPSKRIAAAGTGGAYIYQNRDRAWQRELLSLVNQHDRGKVSDQFIADRLAQLNYETHEALEASGDRTVGSRSIVVWRRRPDARPGTPGGGHQFYTGVDRDPDCPTIPTIGNGMDVQAIAGIFMKQFQRRIADHGFAPTALNFDKDELTQMLAGIPDQPDEKLR